MTINDTLHRLLLDNLTTATILLNAELRLEYMNPAAEMLLAVSGQRSHGQFISELFTESHEALREEASRRLAALDDPSCLEPALAWLEDPRIPNAPAAVRALLAKLGARARGLAERALELGRPGALAWAAGWIASLR